MSNFVNSLEKQSNLTKTENGAAALKSTGDMLLDIFGAAAANRQITKEEMYQKMSVAYGEDPLLALKLAFYTRDIRGLGIGERNNFRKMITFFAERNSEAVRKNLPNIPFYGRWDDLLCLLGTSVEKDVIELIEEQLIDDMKNMRADEPISLLSKWMPSINASSEKTRGYAKILCAGLGLTKKEYSTILSSLRSHLKIVEKFMSEKQWGEIHYPSVPSYCMKRNLPSFFRHDEKRLTTYLSRVKQGAEKINSSTLYPYDLVEQVRRGTCTEATSAQWDALPNYVNDGENILIMADTSGSMTGRPMDTAVGLALYFAERAKGPFHNYFMTFSKSPTLQKVVGESFKGKVKNLMRADWDMNTDLEKAMDLILDTAVKTSCPQEDLPKSLIIISDMQFDNCVDFGDGDTFYDSMKEKYAEAGYTIPNVVFWNVKNSMDTFQVTSSCDGVQLVSGQSINTFKSILSPEKRSPYGYMISVLNDEYFDRVVL